MPLSQKPHKIIPQQMSDQVMDLLESFCLKNYNQQQVSLKKKAAVDDSSDDDLYGDLLTVKKDFSQLENQAQAQSFISQLQQSAVDITIENQQNKPDSLWANPLTTAQNLNLDEMFKDDPDQKNKFKSLLPQESSDKDVMVYDYFEKNSKQEKTVQKKQFDPTTKGFDIRQFRMKQAAQREQEDQKRKQKGVKGLGQFNTKEADEGFGISMMNMQFSKAKEIVIDSQKVIQNFQDEEAIRQDEEYMQDTSRKNFAFGGINVKDRILKRKQQRLANQANKIDEIIEKKKNKVEGQESEEDSDNNDGYGSEDDKKKDSKKRQRLK
eukprot:403358402